VVNQATGRKKSAAAKAAQPISVPTRSRPFAHAPHELRIIGGVFKRSRIAVADVPGLRPTPDRVRETLFNWIAHLRPDLSALRGLDLFAGAGGLGFELASRGAREVVMVERDRNLLANLHAVRARLGAASVRIVGGDAFAVEREFRAESFDVIFLDPPFDAGLNDRALAIARRLVTLDGLVYLESATVLDSAQAQQSGFDILRSDRAGKVFFHLLLRRNDGIIAPSEPDRERGIPQ
jgi:16S rRNA (guanine(966)-N(2))-methyltransferase RsmD